MRIHKLSRAEKVDLTHKLANRPSYVTAAEKLMLADMVKRLVELRDAAELGSKTVVVALLDVLEGKDDQVQVSASISRRCEGYEKVSVDRIARRRSRSRGNDDQ